MTLNNRIRSTKIGKSKARIGAHRLVSPEGVWRGRVSEKAKWHLAVPGHSQSARSANWLCSQQVNVNVTITVPAEARLGVEVTNKDYWSTLEVQARKTLDKISVTFF